MSEEENKPFYRYLEYLAGRTKVRLYTVQLGVWAITIRKELRPFSPSFPKFKGAKSFIRHLGPAWMFVRDIYRIAPRQFLVFVLHRSWLSIDGGLTLYVSGKLTEASLNFLQGQGNSSRSQIAYALLAQSALVFVRQTIDKLTFHDLQVLKDRIKFHFLQKALEHELGDLDNTTISTDDMGGMLVGPVFPRSFLNNIAPDAWFTFDALSNTLSSIARCFSQLYFGFSLVKQYRFDPIYIVLTLSKPYFTFATSPEFYKQDYLIYCINGAYKRLIAMQQLAFNNTYRTDIQSDGLARFIIREFKHCRNLVGDEHTDHVAEQWPYRQSIFRSSMTDCIGLLSANYFVLKAVFQPGSLSLNSYTLLQQTSHNIAFTIYTLTQELKTTTGRFEAIRCHYPEIIFEHDPDVAGDVESIHNLPIDLGIQGENISSQIEPLSEEMPPVTPFSVAEGASCAMQIQFRNVSFTYPGTGKKALENISFTIKPGQLVAIVGINGSGKSTITNLINRLYDPDVGEVLIDGVPIRESNLAQVRRSMAILRQNHFLYPLSLRENIALALPDQDVSDEQIDDAMRDGGAHGFVQKLPDKVNTNLRPVLVNEGTSTQISEELGLKEELWTSLSGGESQRLAASRAFLRLKGGKIRFVAADEPSSALDPEGEHDLFAKLREHRGKTTVVFITHRFGHVTKHADLILCMKDGLLVEQGTHEELIEKRGEYHKLHSVQAQAF